MMRANSKRPFRSATVHSHTVWSEFQLAPQKHVGVQKEREDRKCGWDWGTGDSALGPGLGSLFNLRASDSSDEGGKLSGF